MYNVKSGDFNEAAEDNFKLISVIVFIALFIYSIRYYSLGAHQYAFMCVKASGIVLISIYIFYKKGITFTASNLLMIAGYYCMGIGAFVNGGIESPSICWFPVMIAFSGYFMDLKNAVPWILIIIITLILLIIPSKFGLQINSELSVEQLNHARALSTATSGLIMFVFFFTYRIYKENILVEIKEQRENLQYLNSNLETSEAVLYKQLDNNVRLVRVLTHDLANPLTIIKLSENKLKQDVPITKRILSASRTMEEIITSVREFHASSSGKTILRREVVDLEKTIKNVIDLFEEKLNLKELKTEIKFETDNHEIIADQKILTNQVIANIFSNAIKFSPKGSSITFKICSAGNNKVTLSIKDSGIGIPQSLLSKMFAFDQKTSRTGTDGEKGTGFGMPLMKSYLDMMNCELEVTSTTQDENPTNSGTEFKIYLESNIKF